jgi:hypothetical protein
MLSRDAFTLPLNSNTAYEQVEHARKTTPRSSVRRPHRGDICFGGYAMTHACMNYR